MDINIELKESSGRPKISVALITYNHENFIDQAIASVIAQNTSYTYELVIGDDKSTDSTREKIISWSLKYPHIIKLVLQDENIGAAYNSNAVLKACTGDYIAVLEGDDYWTNCNKLQIQGDVLENDPNIAMCFHLMQEFNENTKKFGRILPTNQFWQFEYPPEYLLDNHIIQTATKMWRREFLPFFPDIGRSIRQLDRAMDVILASQGRVVLIRHNMSVYRLHDNGIWVGANNNDQNIGLYYCLDYLYRNISGPIKSKVLEKLIGVHTDIISHLFKTRDVRIIMHISLYLNKLNSMERKKKKKYMKWLLGLFISNGHRG